MNSKDYVLGWDMWFDDGSDTPKHYHCESMADLEGLPRDGLQAWIIHFADGTRHNVTGDVQFCAPHPAGGLIISGYGNGTLSRAEMFHLTQEISIDYPGAICFMACNTTHWIHKQAAEAAASMRM